MHASKVNKTLQDVSFPSPHWKERVLFISQHQFQQSRMSMLQTKKSSAINGSCVTNGSHESHTAVLRNSRFTCTRRWISVYLKCWLYLFFAPKKKKVPAKCQLWKKVTWVKWECQYIYIYIRQILENFNWYVLHEKQNLPRFPVASGVIELEISPLKNVMVHGV